MKYSYLINELYKEYPSKEGITITKNNELQGKTSEFICDLLGQNFGVSFTLDVLLNNPFLWIDFNIDDWCFILQNVKRAMNLRFLMDNHGCLADFIFLNKYLNINSIDLYLGLNKIDSENKVKTLKLLRLAKYEFIFAETNKEEFFNEELIIKYETILEISEKLINQGASSGFLTLDKLENFLDKIEDTLGKSL